MTFYSDVESHPNHSKSDVLRKFVPKLCSLPHQLDTHYHPDHFLCDRLLMAVDEIPRMDDCIDSLGDSILFTTLDANSEYCQVEIRE